MNLGLLQVIQVMRRPDMQGNQQPFAAEISRAVQELLPRVRHLEDRHMLPLPGLYGRMGVLPDYFTDELVKEDPEFPVLREFFDIFHNRLHQLLFDIWQRYHFFTEDVIEPKCAHARREAFYLNCLLGSYKPLPEEDQPYAKPGDPLFVDEQTAFQALRWHKISLYRRGTRSAEGLKELLATFFPKLEMKLECMVAVDRPVPSHQRIGLGGRFQLGKDGVLGTMLRDLAGGIRLTVSDLDYATYVDLLGDVPKGQERESLRQLLAQLINDYTRGRILTYLTLELRGEEVPRWQLGRPDPLKRKARLGRQLWACSRPLSEDAHIDVGAV